MSKDSGGFLRKVARFVANPTTDWTQLDAPSVGSPESEYAKTEIKAMIERKRRNDFVRKRELDMLRKIRREGLSQDNALALSGASNLDSESRPHSGPRSDIAVKAKIDAIEQQMVGDQSAARQAAQSAPAAPRPPPLPLNAAAAYAPTAPNELSAPERLKARSELSPLEFDPPEISQAVFDSARANQPRMSGSPPPPMLNEHLPPTAFTGGAGVEVTEMEHDPELDEAVIAFANADFDECERALLALIAPGGPRHEQSETWMAVFDLYRALDLPQKFDHLAVSFAHQFGLSAPHWYSLPQRVQAFVAISEQQAAVAAKANQGDEEGPATEPGEGEAAQPRALEGWLSPAVIDSEAVAQLRYEILQLPRPWTMDWSNVQKVEPEGAAQLSQLMKAWAKDPIGMAWIGADQLLSVLAESSPSGARDADPAYWMLRLDTLRLCNRPDQFDEVAIEYCVTYELSPPSWEASACQVRHMRDGVTPHTVMLSHVSDVTTSFVESQMHDDIEFVQVAALNLSGQLIGDISETLRKLDNQLGASITLDIDCEHLLRVDFIAAGDLLNWVLARRGEDREVTFVKPHRLVALFFGAMGINEHAKVKLQLI
ncbi:STAS domain-containing protein [Aquabacterium sp.]|uniref:STAS domain-containing protein n=1 Tax=Aquabacterium sp. TaxID=1872578 RepID=UPI00248A508B|nr:STAS domain-containing protein [Aquabacterium sp.]MDI1258768.1 STAS domain-containing protein [Aquabacterium sp.]